MKPADTLKKTTAFLANLKRAKKMSLVVGLPKETATSKVYPSGRTALEIGAFHEFGAGNNPVRSFLRVPFAVKNNDIKKIFLKLFKGIAEKGADAKTQMGRAGVFLQNISKESFENKGFGAWPDIKAGTKAAKGSSAILIDKGILRSSISYEVRE